MFAELILIISNFNGDSERYQAHQGTQGEQVPSQIQRTKHFPLTLLGYRTLRSLPGDPVRISKNQRNNEVNPFLILTI